MHTAAELIGALLGMLFLSIGVFAVAASTLQPKARDKAILWFGATTTLYGLRLLVRSRTVQDALPAVPSRVWNASEDVLTYLIMVPGALLVASALGASSRFKYLWRANLAAAAIAIAWDIGARRSGAAMPLNQLTVVVNIVIAAVAAFASRGRLSRDATIVLSGAAVFGAVALYETMRGGIFDPIDLEPAAMLVLVGCLGYVVVTHVIDAERRVAAIGRELETARRIQTSILPKSVPCVAGLAIATHYESMSEVAGDLYDFVVTRTGHLGILVADVSGHGVPAALVASMVKIALAVQEGEVADPGSVLSRMNRALCGRFELAYVTATFALIDPVARTVTYASAGHPPPLLVRAGPATVESLDERGMVLGFMPDATYQSAVVRDLGAGDRMVLYTDGITEASRPDGEFYGDRRFHEVLAGGLSQPADRFTAGLVGDARRWVNGTFTDDVTVVVVDLVG
jgi:sigma-B regulation protein RsbU (phosphoserine phosphatase)